MTYNYALPNTLFNLFFSDPSNCISSFTMILIPAIRSGFTRSSTTSPGFDEMFHRLLLRWRECARRLDRHLPHPALPAREPRRFLEDLPQMRFRRHSSARARESSSRSRRRAVYPAREARTIPLRALLRKCAARTSCGLRFASPTAFAISASSILSGESSTVLTIAARTSAAASFSIACAGFFLL